jgi:hypothetical protein
MGVLPGFMMMLFAAYASANVGPLAPETVSFLQQKPNSDTDPQQVIYYFHTYST